MSALPSGNVSRPFSRITDDMRDNILVKFPKQGHAGRCPSPVFTDLVYFVLHVPGPSN
jgi:hypothetical protein